MSIINESFANELMIENEQTYSNTTIVLITLLVITLIAAIIIIIFLNKMITKPILSVNKQLEEIADGEGDLTISCNGGDFSIC
ncbi:hypothetical protein BKP35_10090 [Anaerobacillus arseniciselenatis]|uniref:HAMP domain-containing protein n=1 Tax=Anaerobacillus arseniciselenatis TaxID=85682 RepID=A0A1S2LKN7_9BACI|nr:hypothetical protein BKP35_10090 [Anaerobacillus arseniciselenatis]